MKLIIAEKPSVGRDLARVLLPSSARSGEGCIQSTDICVTWCIGHLVSIANPEEIKPEWKRWESSALPLVPAKLVFPLTPRNADMAKQLKNISRLLTDATEIINACDAGREGELIWRHVVDFLGWREGKTKASRMWLQSMTSDAMKTAWEQRQSVTIPRYANLAVAAKTREQADWLLGLSMTRAVTLAKPRADVNKGAAVWSVGRVQTPVLALIVRRDAAIAAFKSVPFWRVEVDFAGERGVFKANLDVPLGQARAGDDWLDRFQVQQDASAAAEDSTNVSGWSCRDTGKDGKEFPPLPFSLSSLQQHMAKVYGWQAQKTLTVAQECYEKHKILTYPRTESNYLPDDYVSTADQVFMSLVNLPKEALMPSVSPQIKRLFDSSKISDHFAIIPTERRPGADVEGDARKLWDTVVARFVIAFGPTAEFTKTDRVLTRDKLTARTSGTVYRTQGWRALSSILAGETNREEEQEESKALAPCGTTAESSEARVQAGKTTPPKPYDEASLLAVLENVARVLDDEGESVTALRDAIKARGLGTPATRASIIETLINRAFLERVKVGKKTILRSTNAGRELVDFLVAQGLGNLTKAEETAEWEVKLQGIEEGSGMSREEFLTALIETMEAGLKRMKGAFEQQSAADAGIDTGVICPRSGSPVLERNTYYVFPGWGEMKMWKKVRAREISAQEYSIGLAALERREETPLLTFKSGAGNEYQARLAWKIQDKELDFVIPSREDGSEITKPVETGAIWNNEPIMDHGKYFTVVVRKKDGFRIKLWKEVASKVFSVEEYLAILEAKKTKAAPPIHEFFSGAKQRNFKAGVDLEPDGKVRFVFA